MYTYVCIRLHTQSLHLIYIVYVVYIYIHTHICSHTPSHAITASHSSTLPQVGWLQSTNYPMVRVIGMVKSSGISGLSRRTPAIGHRAGHKPRKKIRGAEAGGQKPGNEVRKLRPENDGGKSGPKCAALLVYGFWDLYQPGLCVSVYVYRHVDIHIQETWFAWTHT